MSTAEQREDQNAVAAQTHFERALALAGENRQEASNAIAQGTHRLPMADQGPLTKVYTYTTRAQTRLGHDDAMARYYLREALQLLEVHLTQEGRP